MERWQDWFSLSPQRGEGRGEGWECGDAQSMSDASEGTTPHPQSLSPLRGEGSRSRSVVSKHSPILLAYPPVWIYSLGEPGIEHVAHIDTAHYQMTCDSLTGRGGCWIVVE